MTETVLTHDNEPLEGVVKGRSLLDTALLRLKRNRAAMVSLWVIICMTLAAIIGPTISSHSYDEVYNHFVGEKPSIGAYPKQEQITPITERALSRARVDMEDINISKDSIKIYIVNRKQEPLDPRITRYLLRADIFQNVSLKFQKLTPTRSYIS